MITAMIAPPNALRVSEWPISEDTNVSAAKRPTVVQGMSAQLIGMAMLLSIACPFSRKQYQIACGRDWADRKQCREAVP
jgi:hypothetical protein